MYENRCVEIQFYKMHTFSNLKRYAICKLLEAIIS